MDKSFKLVNFPGNDLHSVVLPVKANIAESLIGDWERITVAEPKGIQGVPRYSISYENDIIWSQ